MSLLFRSAAFSAFRSRSDGAALLSLYREVLQAAPFGDLVEMSGFEPLASCLQGRRSTN